MNEIQETPERDRLRDMALFAPRFLKLIARLLADSGVPMRDKILLGAAAAYVVSPFDIVPDSIPVVGHLDDVYLLALCLLRLLHRSGEEKIRQHWDGPEDIVHILNSITDLATRYLPDAVRGRIRSWVEARTVG